MTKTPKIIWQTWKTKNSNEIPDDLAKYSKLWKKLHPFYEYHLLDDDDLRSIVSDVVPQYLEDYDSFSYTIEKVDFARYAILYKYGGIYADMDTYPYKSLDTFVNLNKIVLGKEPVEHAQKIYNKKEILCNALMISPPNEELWLKFMDFIIENYEHNFDAVYNTGPLAMTDFFEKNPEYKKKVIITDPCIFYPLKNNGEVTENCNLDDSYVAHVWNNSWAPTLFDNKKWKNVRYWTIILLIIYFMLWFYLFYKGI